MTITKAQLGPLIQKALEDRAVEALREHGPMRGSDLGWMLWGDSTPHAERGEGSHGHNKFCRVAGKLLKRLQKQGRVIQKSAEGYSLWEAI